MSDATRRDRYGRYLVVPPNGGKPTGYTRVTTVAKALDDGAGLLAWGACATIVGAHRMRGLQARWQALLAASPDPWYDSPESKAEAKKLVEECKVAGGSADRADLGTALHTMVEQHLYGNQMPLLDDTTRADINAFDAAITAAGIRFDTDMLEQMVVLDALKIAGRADQLVVHVPGFPLPLIGDLKTGASLDYSMPAIAIQLAAYANASNRYIQGEATDGSDDQRLPMPEVSRTHAVVFHLPAGEARCTIHVVDIAAGYDALLLAVEARQWRTRRNLSTLLSLATPIAIEADAGVVEHSRPTPATSQSSKAYSATRPAPAEGDVADQSAVDALKAAYDALTVEHRAWIGGLFKQAQHGGVSFALSSTRTVRRFELMRALVRLAKNDITDIDVLRALAAGALDDFEALNGLVAGHLIGCCDVTAATTFARLADDLIDGRLAAAYNHNGLYFETAA